MLSKKPSRLALTNRHFIVKMKPAVLSVRVVDAATVEMHGEHLVFCDSGGSLSALFLLEDVQSWNEV